MNRVIRGLDLNGAQVLHAEEIGPDDWRATDHERRGMCTYTWQGTLSRIADLIAEGWVRTLEAGPEAAYPDLLGNVWRHGEYLPPDRWLVQVIPPYPPPGR